jgi:hypothetical protein
LEKYRIEEPRAGWKQRQPIGLMEAIARRFAPRW